MVNYQQLSTLHLEKNNYFSFTININLGVGLTRMFNIFVLLYLQLLLI